MDRTRRKTNKVLFNLKKRNYVTKTLLQIKLDNGEITSDMKKINKQIDVYFSETYKSKLTDVPLSEQELGLNDFIQNLEIPRLSNEEQATFEHELTVQYVAQYPDDTSIRTLDTKTQFLRRPFQFSVNDVFQMKAAHFSFKMKVLAI